MANTDWAILKASHFNTAPNHPLYVFALSIFSATSLRFSNAERAPGSSCQSIFISSPQLRQYICARANKSAMPTIICDLQDGHGNPGLRNPEITSATTLSFSTSFFGNPSRKTVTANFARSSLPRSHLSTLISNHSLMSVQFVSSLKIDPPADRLVGW